MLGEPFGIALSTTRLLPLQKRDRVDGPHIISRRPHTQSTLAPLSLCIPQLSQQQENPRNRLSKFQYYAGDTTTTRASEDILLTTIPKFNSIHAAGWVGFKPSDYGSNVSNGIVGARMARHEHGTPSLTATRP